MYQIYSEFAWILVIRELGTSRTPIDQRLIRDFSNKWSSTIVDPWSAIFHPMLFRGAKTIQFRGIKKVEPEPNISECGFKQTFIRNSPTADGFIIWCFEALQPEIMAHCFFPLILFYPGKSFQFIRVWQVFRGRT